jgi:DNA repair protein RecO (recombination protein O)
MYTKTQAFVVSTLKYGDADLIVKLYTKSHGMLSFMLKGVRKSKKGKLKVSYFQSLSFLDVEFTYRENKNLFFFKEVGVHHSFNAVQRNIYKSTLSLFIAEILQACIKEEESNTAIFNFIEDSLKQLDEAEQFGHFHILFMLQLSKHLGFYPNLDQQSFAYFNLVDGVFQLKETNRYCFSGSEVENLKLLLGYDYTNQNLLKIKKQERIQVLELLILYYEIQIQGFKKPLSYQVLQEVFATY